MALRASLLFWYGRLLTTLKRRARALAVFRAVTRVDPSHRRAWSAIGFLLAAREELQPALKAFEQATALNPAERALEGDPGLERARRGLERSLAAREE
jgi:tetratricopeptide (TPR) repeat protein